MPKFPHGLSQRNRQELLVRFNHGFAPYPHLPQPTRDDIDIIFREYRAEEQRLLQLAEDRQRRYEEEMNQPFNIGELDAPIDMPPLEEVVIVRNPMELVAMMIVGPPVARVLVEPRQPTEDEQIAEAIRRSMID